MQFGSQARSDGPARFLYILLHFPSAFQNLLQRSIHAAGYGHHHDSQWGRCLCADVQLRLTFKTFFILVEAEINYNSIYKSNSNVKKKEAKTYIYIQYVFAIYIYISQTVDDI